VRQPPWLVLLDQGERFVEPGDYVNGGNVGTGILDHDGDAAKCERLYCGHRPPVQLECAIEINDT
jgi:hypothetical protein